MAKFVFEFKLKLVLFQNEIEEEDFNNFPTLQKHFGEEIYDTPRFIKYLDVLIDEFDECIFQISMSTLFDFDSEEIKELSDIF